MQKQRKVKIGKTNNVVDRYHIFFNNKIDDEFSMLPP
jgi:hypothetical protein